MDLRRDGYWDEHYELELRNYQEDGDLGDVWFGKGLNRRIVTWVLNRIVPALTTNSSVNIIDIGCGNAFTPCSLYERLLSEHQLDPTDISDLKILGLDYACNSIELSKKILSDKAIADRIQIKQCDFIDTQQVKNVTDNLNFDYIIDKGTFDAICLLSSETNQLLERTKLKYMESLYSLVSQRSIFILASCNHTEEELLSLFNIDCPTRKEARLIDRIESQKIQFGGKEGSQVTCIIMELVMK